MRFQRKVRSNLYTNHRDPYREEEKKDGLVRGLVALAVIIKLQEGLDVSAFHLDLQVVVTAVRERGTA